MGQRLCIVMSLALSSIDGNWQHVERPTEVIFRKRTGIWMLSAHDMSCTPFTIPRTLRHTKSIKLLQILYDLLLALCFIYLSITTFQSTSLTIYIYIWQFQKMWKYNSCLLGYVVRCTKDVGRLFGLIFNQLLGMNITILPLNWSADVFIYSYIYCHFLLPYVAPFLIP